jgi:hypothetical protein
MPLAPRPCRLTSPTLSPTAVAPRPRHLATPTPSPTAPRLGPAPSPPRSLTRALAYGAYGPGLAPSPPREAAMANSGRGDDRGGGGDDGDGGPGGEVRPGGGGLAIKKDASGPAPSPPRLTHALAYGRGPVPSPSRQTRTLAYGASPWPRALATSPHPRPCLWRLAMAVCTRRLGASPAPSLTVLAPRPRRLASPAPSPTAPRPARAPSPPPSLTHALAFGASPWEPRIATTGWLNADW